MIVKTDPDLIAPYVKDASNLGGYADEVLIPENQEELRKAIALCAMRQRPITIAGARTGLVGAAVPQGGAVISTERLKAMRIDDNSFCAFVEPGVILADVQKAAQSYQLLYPPDPTERNSSLGGNIATNASGARTFKYGATRAFVERLCIVLSDGEELDLRRGETMADGYHLELYSVSGRKYELMLPALSMPDIKHAAGYFIKPGMDALDLFIGSEGTLGVVAEIDIRLLPLPEHVMGGIAFFEDTEALLSFVDEARERSTQSDKTLLHARALEYFDEHSLCLIADLYPQIPSCKGAIWFEQEYQHDEDEVLAAWYTLLQQYTVLADQTWIARTMEEREELRAFRHAVPARVYERITELGQTKVGTDMAVPVPQFRDLFHFYREQAASSGLEYVIYGHIGNCHLHVNFFVNDEAQYQCAQQLYSRCINRVLAMGGTVSAEHGVGKIKRDYLRRMYGDAAIRQFIAMKKVLDPFMLFGRNTMFSLPEDS